MNAFISDLNQKERSLLYTAMLFFREQGEQRFAESLFADMPPLLKAFYAYTEAETKALMEKLFSECFPEDLEFAKHFNEHWKNQHTKEISPATDSIQPVTH